jgi:phage gpG-like protein
MFARLTGADALENDLANLPADLQARLEAKSRDLARALVAKVRDEKLSGGVLQTKTGALKDSISADISLEGGSLTATIGSFGDIKYAAIQEYGGRTSAHEIVADKARALAFLVGGALRFARRVSHPGSTIPPHAYLLSSLDESRDEIVAELASVATEAWDDR